MSAKEGLVTGAVATDRPARRVHRSLAGAAFWLLGSMLVIAAQSNTDRRIAAAGAAVAGVATLVVVGRLTSDPRRRYFRSLVGVMVAVSVAGDWVLDRLSSTNGFVNSGLDTRIALPLMFVLLAPLVLEAFPRRLRPRALWRDRTLPWREASPLDWLVTAYGLLIVPGLLLGLAHHAPKSYIAQDLGLIVFFVFAYVAGRTVSVDAGRASAAELVEVLLVLAAAQAILGWDTTPLFTFVDAAAAASVVFAFLQPRKTRLVPFGLALVLLGAAALQVKHGSGSTTAIELAGATAVMVYVAVRLRALLPQWLLVGLAVIGLAAFIAFTSDGATVRGQYGGADPSNLGRNYEGHQVLEAIHGSPVSFLFGRGLGGNIDETHAPKIFANTLVYGGRDLAHVQEVHLLPYEFLLKYGLVGFALLGALVAGVAILAIRALETATRHRDPTPVVYAALPLLGIAAALAAATHLQDNPLTAFAVGVLVTRLPRDRARRLSLGLALPVAAALCAIVGVAVFAGSVGRFVIPKSAANAKPGTARSVGPPQLGGVGDLQFYYPAPYHVRTFISANKAVTGVSGTVAQGAVVASYPLAAQPEIGASGESLRQHGVLFELMQAPRQRRHPAPKEKFPLTFAKLHPVVRGGSQLGRLYFRAKGHTYLVVAWVGKDATQAEKAEIAGLIISIQPR